VALTLVAEAVPVVVLNRDTYFSTAHLNHSVSQHELPRLVIAVWPGDDVQCGWVQVPLGSAGAPIALHQIWFQLLTFQTKSNGCAMLPGLQPPTLAVRRSDPSGYLCEV
jgi:hypothetical protein